MDLEVTRAIRTLQRVGMDVPLTSQMDAEEFQLNFGKLLHQWLIEHGVHCEVFRLGPSDTVRRSNNSYTATAISAATARCLSGLFQKHHKKEPSHLIYRNISGFGAQYITLKEHEPDSAIIGKFLSNFTINIIDQSLGYPGKPDRTKDEGFPPPNPNELMALLFYKPYTVNNSFVAQFFYFREETPEETLQRGTKLATKEQKATAAKEKARKTLEEKEKKTLQHLLIKYKDING